MHIRFTLGKQSVHSLPMQACALPTFQAHETGKTKGIFKCESSPLTSIPRNTVLTISGANAPRLSRGHRTDPLPWKLQSSDLFLLLSVAVEQIISHLQEENKSSQVNSKSLQRAHFTIKIPDFFPSTSSEENISCLRVSYISHFSWSASENSAHLQIPIISQYCQCNWSW